MASLRRRWANHRQPTVTPKYQRWYTNNPLSYEVDNLHDYAIEMAASNIRYGKGATREVGYDMVDLKAKRVAVFVDPNLMKLQHNNSPVYVALQSLTDRGIQFSVFSDIAIEPTDTSFRKAIAFAQSEPFDAFLAVGGGSTMDTCKAANLYASYPPEDFFDYVNPPQGKGKVPPGPLKPLIAIPTTSGTGSETTGVAIFDWEEKKCKTGIAHRLLKPTLGIVDPNNTATLPPNVIAYSGFDVLCHSLESYTALPFYKRPRPNTPKERPSYQGANPISDFWSLKSLEMTSKYIVRAYKDPEDEEARAQMLMASTFAGIGFGNAGVHLCHGMSYPISGLSHKLDFCPDGYPKERSMVPHGMSVVLNAPAVFEWTSSADPDRHAEVARVMGADTHNVTDADVGKVLAEEILKLMQALDIPDGLSALGYTEDDIPDLVEGAVQQHRVTKLSPRPVDAESLAHLFSRTMNVY